MSRPVLMPAAGIVSVSVRVSEREWVDQRKEVIRDLGAQPSAQRPPAARPCLSVPSARSQYDSTRPSPTVLAAVVRTSPQLDPHDPSSRVTLTCVRCRRSAELRLPASAPSEASGDAQKALSPSERWLVDRGSITTDSERRDTILQCDPRPSNSALPLARLGRGQRAQADAASTGLRAAKTSEGPSAVSRWRRTRPLHPRTTPFPAIMAPYFLGPPAGTFYPGSPHLRS